MAWKNDQVSSGETGEILRWAHEMLEVEGDFVEMGCYRGDTSLVLAEVLKEHNEKMKDESRGFGADDRGEAVEKSVEKPVEKLGKRLWIHDSFEGLPEKGDKDESALGVDFRKGELCVTKREVKGRFLRAGLPVPVIKKAWFSDLTEADLPGKIAFAFLDGDLYESIKISLQLVGPKMNPSGIIIVHDYYNPALPGVAEAVNEWAQGKNLHMERFESMVLIRV